jgi:predicted RND superfamily exporter protein
LPSTLQVGTNLLGKIPKHPLVVTLVVLLIALLSLTRIVDLQTGEPLLQVDSSVDSLLPSSDEDRAFLDRVKEMFAFGDTILLLFEDEDIFTTANLTRIQQISEQLERLPEVDRVSSLSLSINIRSDDGGLIVEPFFDEVPSTPRGLAELKRRALEDPIYRGSLVSEDARSTVVIVHLFDMSDMELHASAISARINDIAKRIWTHSPYRMTGTAHVKIALNEIIVSDMTVIVPITWVLMSLVTFIVFRSVRSVLITLISIQVSVLITVGFIAYQYGTLNQVTSAVPSVLFVVGLAYAIHVLSAYYDALRDQRAGLNLELNPVQVALETITVPVIFTGLTTAAGFLSLATSRIQAVREYGISTGVGVLITMFVSLTLVPAILQMLPVPKVVRGGEKHGRFASWLVRVARFDIRNRKAILVAGFLIAVISLAGMFRIQVGYDMVRVFMPNHPVRLDFEAVNESLEGANGFDIVLETSVTEGFKDPENLEEIEDLQRWLARQPEVGGSTSFVDYIKAIHKGIEGGDPGSFVIPASKELVSQLLVIGENEEIDQFVAHEYQAVKIGIRTTAMNSRSVLSLVERIEERLAEISPHIRSRVTGDSVLVSRTMDDIAFGQALSMLTAFGSIFVILMVLFASFRTGLIALVPNVLPVLMYFGILGWAGIELNATTGIIACLVLGIAVDDTIHLLSHFNRDAKLHADEEHGITHALLSIGRPVTCTTVALCLGFLCLMFSDMRTQFEFGWLAAVTLVGAWVVDMTFTPALAAGIRVVTIWDIVSLDLGEEPQISLPLFHGLSANQARVGASMATIDKFSAGDQVFKVNDPGDFLYVIIDGQLRVSVQNEAGEVILSQLERGAMLGEIALFNGVRSADVIATTDARLLRLTVEDLAQIQRRRPRIGAQIYANMNRAQALRTVSLTNRVR